MIVKLLTEHHLVSLSLKGGRTGSSEATHVKIPHCWKSHALAYIIFICFIFKDGATTLYKIRVHAIYSASDDQPYTFACDTSQLTDDTVSAGPLTVAG